MEQELIPRPSREKIFDRIWWHYPSWIMFDGFDRKFDQIGYFINEDPIGALTDLAKLPPQEMTFGGHKRHAIRFILVRLHKKYNISLETMRGLLGDSYARSVLEEAYLFSLGWMNEQG